MDTFLRNLNKRILTIILFSWTLPPACIANAGELNVGKIWAAGYFGKDNVEEIAPYSEIERWKWGEFDPPKIVLRLDVASKAAVNAKVTLFLRVKAGKVLFNEKSGINLIHLQKTARWQEEKVLPTKKLKVEARNKESFSHIFSLDDLVTDLQNKKLSPYLLSFRVVVQDMGTLEKYIVRKQIFLIPDNVSDY